MRRLRQELCPCAAVKDACAFAHLSRVRRENSARLTRLASGSVLVTGGKSGSSTLGTTLVFTIPASGSAATWPTAGTMTAVQSLLQRMVDPRIQVIPG